MKFKKGDKVMLDDTFLNPNYIELEKDKIYTVNQVANHGVSLKERRPYLYFNNLILKPANQLLIKQKLGIN